MLLKSLLKNVASISSKTDAAALYIDLLKKCVSNAIYDDDLDLMRGKLAPDERSGALRSVEAAPASANAKYHGFIWPSRAHTMIGMPRLDNLQECTERVLADGVPGDFIETGVWRGGASIFTRGILKAHGVRDRVVWVADSFRGLPAADHERYPGESTANLHMAGDLAVSLEQVRGNFERYDLLDDQVRFLEGWFRDTLPAAPIERLALMRLDGDLYESTMDGLVHLYSKLSSGGFVIVDDYNALDCCNAAVHDFRSREGVTEKLKLISGAGAYWRKA
jgi:hypothetical protein